MQIIQLNWTKYHRTDKPQENAAQIMYNMTIDLDGWKLHSGSPGKFRKCGIYLLGTQIIDGEIQTCQFGAWFQKRFHGIQRFFSKTIVAYINLYNIRIQSIISFNKVNK